MKTWIPDARNFAYLNWKQVDALPRESTLLVLPTAAIEQHGHHLPLATDTLINNLLLGHALAKLPPESVRLRAAARALRQEQRAYRLSRNAFGERRHIHGRVARSSARASSSAGFQKLVLYNTHGGNTALIDVMARDLRAEFGLRTFALHGSGGAFFEGLTPQERAYGFHAGEVETAFLLASVPELVDRSAYTVNYIADVAKPEMLLPENAPATFAWLTRDIAPSGVMGDPRPATAENGARWIEQAATRLARVEAHAAAVRMLSAFAKLLRITPLSPDTEDRPLPPSWIDCGNGVRLERGVRCRMSDGVELVSDHYYPPQPGPHPTLLMRQPYGRDIASTVVYAHPVWFARHGYNVVIQDVRGRGDSGGDFYPFRNEGRDGAETIAWLRTRPESNGRVGMYGFSYQGMTQLLAAAEQPEGSLCIAPGMTAHDLYHGWFYHHGALRLASTLGWGLQMLKADARRLKLREASDRLEQAWANLAAQTSVLPFRDHPALHGEGLPQYVLDWFDHAEPGEYWTALDVSRKLDRIRVPALHVSGWYDTYLQGQHRRLSRAVRKRGQRRARAKINISLPGRGSTFPGAIASERRTSAPRRCSIRTRFCCAGSIIG